MTETDSNDDSSKFDKLLAELEKETLSEEPKPIINKQIKRAKDEYDETHNTVDDRDDKELDKVTDEDYFD